MQRHFLEQWRIYCGDILDISADVLICSANTQLNLSGGVGGSILVRFGDRMQQELWSYLKKHDLHFVPVTTVVQTNACGTPYNQVLHAVAIDVFYQTNLDTLLKTLRQALKICVQNNAKKVALTALATGYGRYSIDKFAECIKVLQCEDWTPIELITIGIQNCEKTRELSILLDIPVINKIE